ncbi:MAG TPA: fucose isomerase, partial [Candidatus Sumerlaeota bacterium]|nr:fucose isomerase [Candidatus Sumerlaeota bacterium]
MAKARKVAVFWPGDYRPMPNKQALPNIEKATAQMEAALRKLGRQPYRIKGYMTRPSDAIEKLGPIDDPIVGIFVHWVYGPHTVDGVSGKENPLLLASNFSGQWPGLVGLLNTGACLEAVNRPFSRIWTDASNWTRDRVFMDRLDEWCSTGRIAYSEDELHYAAPVGAAAADNAAAVAAGIRDRRVLAMMLGDTSMGMTNGYFGVRELHKIGFSEHKVDQAWIVDRVQRISPRRVDDALKFCLDRGVKFHWGETNWGEDSSDFTEDATRTQLKMYLAVLDLLDEFKCDCLGWQYQLGLIPLLPPSDFCEGLLNSNARPEGDGQPIMCATEADQGSLVPMELMKRLLARKGLNQTVNFHDVRWGGKVGNRFIWVLLNSGSCSAYAFNHDEKSLKGVHSYRQPKGYFPIPGGTFTGESLPGKMTWARAYLKNNALWMDIGRGEVLKVPAKQRDLFWEGTTPQWPLMLADVGCSMETVMAHYMS